MYVFRLGMWFVVGDTDDGDVLEAFLSPEPLGKQRFWTVMKDNFVYNFQEMHYLVSMFKQ